uniref:Uncharacterized protein n=1 Tax=Meloidogyne enterolobii TaxID=390850 RepID=A0A6V7V0F4_MELEN|nr:unnamed protein product [Meloidogyne enterolobii]
MMERKLKTELFLKEEKLEEIQRAKEAEAAFELKEQQKKAEAEIELEAKQQKPLEIKEGDTSNELLKELVKELNLMKIV